MAGFQFVHIQGYSRKAMAADAKGRGARASVRDVLAEASRLPGDALHVAAPLPPVHVFGVLVAEVQALHDERCEAARTEVAGGKPRKVRQDQATLLTCIASFSSTVAECAADPVKAAARDDWQRRNVDWAREVWGDDLVSVSRHDDEKHPHLHLLVLPGESSMRANALHPGWVAKQEAKAVAEVDGLDAKDANKAGDRAYRAAMRDFQDAYWNSVGMPCGMARIGPAKRSLPRAEWVAEQRRAVQVGDLVRAAEVAGVTVGEAVERRTEAEALLAQATEAVTQARAEAARARFEADATLQAARTEATRIVAAAKRDAGGIVARAKEQARLLVEQARSVGAVLGAAVFSLVGQSPARSAARGAEAERESASVRESGLRAELSEVRRELSEFRRELADARGVIRSLASERDELRHVMSSRAPGMRIPLASSPLR